MTNDALGSLKLRNIRKHLHHFAAPVDIRGPGGISGAFKAFIIRWSPKRPLEKSGPSAPGDALGTLEKIGHTRYLHISRAAIASNAHDPIEFSLSPKKY
jgi:hypothetical protein